MLNYKIMKRFLKSMLIGIVILSMTTSCLSSSNDFEKGKQMLENQGFTDIKNTGYEYFCCDDKDTFSTGFTAKAKNGAEVSGCFCSKILKGVTIRFN